MTGTPLLSTDSWPHRPLFIKAEPVECGGTLTVDGKDDADYPCPIGKAFEFESELFKGKCLVRIRDLETSTNSNTDKEYFNRRKRNHQVVVQGQFKKEVRANDIVHGAEYKYPMKMAPPAWMEALMTKLFSKLSPGLQMKLSGKHPFVLVNLPSSVQTLRADTPGSEPDIASFDFEEHNAAFGTHGKYTFPMDIKSRKKFFSNFKKSKDVVFDTNTVYTFEIYDDVFNYEKNTMKIYKYNIDMEFFMDKNEPHQIMAKDLNEGKSLWFFNLWHEKQMSQ